MNKSKIGIVGVGYLGGAVKYWFDKRNFTSFFYDKAKKMLGWIPKTSFGRGMDKFLTWHKEKEKFLRTLNL